MWGSTSSFVWTLFLAASHVHRVAATGSPVVAAAAALPTQSFFPQVRGVLLSHHVSPHSFRRVFRVSCLTGTLLGHHFRYPLPVL